MRSNRLEGKTALITGGTSKIGRAIALAFDAEGARVAISGRDPERAEAVVDATEGRAVAILGELDGSKAAAERLAAEAGAAFGGPPDILVNNAGIFPPGTTPTVDEATFDRVYAVNVRAPFFLTAALAPAMAERGSGVIINLGSWVARLSVPVGALYASTKGALETLTRAWAAEFGPAGVRVNAISPGVVQPPGGPSEAMMHGTPAGTVGDPKAVAAAAVYLASDDAAFVHGSTLDVDGGRVAVAVIAPPA